MARRSRIVGKALEGRAIYEPKDAKFSLTLAATGKGKTTCVTIPTVLSLLDKTGSSLFINDVKSDDVAPRIGPLVKRSGRTFDIVNDFGEWPELKDEFVPVDPLGDDESSGGASA